MTLIQLRCFITLAEELNFTRVAEKLYVSQTSITYQIKTLERELGVELFERTTKSVKITDAGRKIYRDIKLAIELVDRAESLLRRTPARPSFTVGYSLLCSGPLFRNTIGAFSAAHRELDFMLEHAEPEDDIHTQLLSGSLDAALFIDPFNTIYDDLRYYELAQTRASAYVSVNHRLAGHRGFVGEREISGERIITCATVEARHRSPADAPDNCTRIMARDVPAAMVMVASNLGIALFPATCFTQPIGVCLLPSFTPPDSDRMSARLALVCRANDANPLIPELAVALRRVVEEHTGV